MDGSQVYAAFKRGEIAAIRDYCETDVANTYLLFQRFQLIRGALDRRRLRAGGRALPRLARRAAGAALEGIRRGLEMNGVRTQPITSNRA